MCNNHSIFKKRTILSIIFTIIFLILSNKYWLIIKYLPDRTSVKFDFLLFIIFLVLIYLLAYKLTDYMANFNTVKGKSRIDIVFLTIFFIFLAIPMIHINHDEISAKENRKLAEWKPLIIEKGVINYNFGRDFEAYFSDRFFLREPITSFYKKLRICFAYKIIEENNIFYNKKTGWAFARSWFEVPDITPQMPEISESIQKLYDFCNKNDISLYVVVVPVKEEVYSDKIEPFSLRQQNGEIYTDYINKNVANIVYYPLSELKEATKTDYTYPKSDPHWVEYGAYIATNGFLEHFGYNPINPNDFRVTEQSLPLITDYIDFVSPTYSGYYYNSLGLKNKQNYKHYTNKKEIKTLLSDGQLLSKDTYFKNAPNPQKVYFICTSYGENFWLFLRYAFKNVIKRRNNNLLYPGLTLDFSRWEQEIIQEKPDILIILTESNYIDKYKSMWDK